MGMKNVLSIRWNYKSDREAWTKTGSRKVGTWCEKTVIKGG